MPASVTTQILAAVSSTRSLHPCSCPTSLLGTCGRAAGKQPVLLGDTPHGAVIPAAAAEAFGPPAALRTQEAPAHGKRQRGAGGEGGHGAEQKRRRKAEAAAAAPAPDADRAGGASGAAAAASAGKETKAEGEKQQTAGGTARVDDAAATPASKAAVANAKKKQKAKDKRDAMELDSLGGVPGVTDPAPFGGSLSLWLPEASRCPAWKGPAVICPAGVGMIWSFKVGFEVVRVLGLFTLNPVIAHFCQDPERRAAWLARVAEMAAKRGPNDKPLPKPMRVALKLKLREDKAAAKREHTAVRPAWLY